MPKKKNNAPCATSYFKIVLTNDNFIFDKYIEESIPSDYKLCRCDSIKTKKSEFFTKSILETKIKRCYITSNVDDADLIVSNFEDMCSGKFQNNHIIILHLSDIDKRSKLYKKCKDAIVEPTADISKITNEIIGSQYDDVLLSELYLKCNKSINRCVLELQKVKLLFNSDLGLHINDCLKLVINDLKSQGTVDTIELVNHITSNNLSNIVNSLLHINTSEFDFGLSTLLYNAFRNIFIVKDAGNNATTDKTGLSPYIINSVRANCPKYSINQLTQILDNLYAIDKDVKSGKIDSSFAFDLMLVRVLS